MPEQRRNISLGIKIFSIALSMLVLLIVVAWFSRAHLDRTNQSVVDLTRYLIPVTGVVNMVDVHVLEQEVQLESILKLYEIEPLDKAHIARQFEQFEARGVQVDEELARATQLLQEAVQQARGASDQEIFTRLAPSITEIEQEHQAFHDLALQVIGLLETGQKEDAHRLVAQLQAEEDRFDGEIDQLRLALQQQTRITAQITRQQQQQVINLNLVMTIIGTVLGLFSASLLTVGLVRPVGKLMNAMREVGRGDLDIELDIKSRDEIGSLADSFGGMVDELVLKEKIKGMFGKYVDPRVVESLIDQPEGPATGGEKQCMTVVFSDIEGFDTIAEQITPQDQVHFINQYLTLMSEPISRHTGVLDKFIGTMVMAFWGLPFTSEADHAGMACEAALDQLAQLDPHPPPCDRHDR
jgi:adenylate cyclase